MAVAQLSAYIEFVEFITSSPSLDEMTQFRLSSDSEQRISHLLELNRINMLSDADEEELDEYTRLEHLMRQMKIRAFEKLQDST